VKQHILAIATYRAYDKGWGGWGRPGFERIHNNQSPTVWNLTFAYRTACRWLAGCDSRSPCCNLRGSQEKSYSCSCTTGNAFEKFIFHCSINRKSMS